MNPPLMLFLLVLGVACVGCAVWLRANYAGKYDLKPTDIILLVLPLIVVRLTTGEPITIDIMGIRTELPGIQQAASTSIARQVSAAAVSSLEDLLELPNTAARNGVEVIPRLFEQEIDILEFTLGMNNYSADVIAQYLEKLNLRYIVINHADGSLFGMYPAADLVAYLDLRAINYNDAPYVELEARLNRGNREDQDALARLPDFIPAEWAVTSATPKRNALQVMANHDRNSLPVINGNGRFVGTVDAATLTASLILAVTESTEQ